MTVPVTILSGFLGAGKTTLLQHILNQIARIPPAAAAADEKPTIHGGLRIALVINDMSEVNVDAAIVRNTESGEAAVAITRVEENIVELSNGCICCTLRDDMVDELIRLSKTGKYDYIIIESSGIGEPMQVAEAFTMANKEGEAVSDFVTLDTAVTVVDAYNWIRDYNSADSLATRGTAAYETDERHVVQLLVEQVQFANVIILNKADLADEEQQKRVTGILKSINKDASIIPAVRGGVPLDKLMHTKLFSMEQASTFSGWLAPEVHVPETVEYNISNFVFRAKRPFHPGRLYDLLYPSEHAENKLHSVVRSKGFFWLAVDGGMDDCGIWAHAGRLFQFSCGSPWWVSIQRKKWPAPVERMLGKAVDEGWSTAGALPPDDAVWDALYGDRRSEIVVIGIAMDHAAIRAALEQALVTPEEYALGADAWDEWDDPFDFFPYEDELDDEDGCEGHGEHAHSHADGSSCTAAHSAPSKEHAHSHADGSTCTKAHGTPSGEHSVRRVVTASGITLVREDAGPK